MAQEHLLLVVAVTDAAELIAHAVFHHHDRAILVACWMSLAAPVRDVFGSEDQLLRIRPPKTEARLASHSLLLMLSLSAFRQVDR